MQDIRGIYCKTYEGIYCKTYEGMYYKGHTKGCIIRKDTSILRVLRALEISAGLNIVRFEWRMNLSASWTTSWIRYSMSMVNCFAASADRVWMPMESATSLTMSVEKRGLAMADWGSGMGIPVLVWELEGRLDCWVCR